MTKTPEWISTHTEIYRPENNLNPEKSHLEQALKGPGQKIEKTVKEIRLGKLTP